MKKSHLRVVSWIFVGSFAWLSSCVKEDNDDCAKQCDVLIVKAIDSDSESVKDNVGVYLFDENLKLEKTINSKLDTNINIERASTKKYTAVCLARTADSPLPIIPLGTSIDQAQLVLRSGTIGVAADLLCWYTCCHFAYRSILWQTGTFGNRCL